NTAITLTNSTLTLVGDTVLNSLVGSENSIINIQGNAVINTPLNLQNDAITIQGNATFTEAVTGNLGGTSSLTIDGQSTVPNGALVVDGITLSLAQSHTCNSIHIKNGGVLTTPVATSEFKNGITLTATTITVDEGSRIDVSDKGLLGVSPASNYTGGSHGGRGGHYSTSQSGPVYGDYQEPMDVGLGGRTNGTGVTRGGGAIRIDADEIILDGGIFANGGGVSSGSQGGGAGGSVWLDVGILRSGTTGEIRANGGLGSSYGGGGGGGRIAVHYETLIDVDQSRISTLGGGRGNGYVMRGSPGTVYLEDKTGTNVHPLHIVGNGSDASYAATTLDVIGNNGLAIETASVEYTGAKLIDADIELINGNFTATGN